MKSLVLFLFLILNSAFAQEFCAYQETWEFQEHALAQGITPVRKTIENGRFNFMERDMIHLAVSRHEFLRGVSLDEALETFHDGEILYYKIAGKEFALVRYYADGSEFGAFFELRRRAYRLVGEINGGFISCY